MESFLCSLFLAQSLFFPVLPFHSQTVNSRILAVHIGLCMVGPLTCAFTNAYLSPSVLTFILIDSNVENRKYTGFFLGGGLNSLCYSYCCNHSVSYLNKWWSSVFFFSSVFRLPLKIQGRQRRNSSFVFPSLFKLGGNPNRTLYFLMELYFLQWSHFLVKSLLPVALIFSSLSLLSASLSIQFYCSRMNLDLCFYNLTVHLIFPTSLSF